MNRDDVKRVVQDAIRTETRYAGELGESLSSLEIEGWDSLAHTRIIFRIEIMLEIEIEINSTYSADTIGDLIDLLNEMVK